MTAPRITPLLAAALLLAAMPLRAQQAATTEHGEHAPADHADHAAHGAQPGTPGTLRTPVPPPTDEDRRAAQPPARGHLMHDNAIHGLLRVDRLEAWDGGEMRGQAWDIEGWLGTDLDRLWLRSEGVRADDATRGAEVGLLYGHSFSRWWDAVAGIRHEFEPGPSRSWVAIGLQGLAPYWIETQLTGYVGEGGRTAAGFDAHVDMFFTGRLILQWQFDAEAHGRNDTSRGIGRGLSRIEVGARLRYEITRRFAPYAGVHWERTLGRTADLHRAAGDDDAEARIVIGLRTWF